MLTQQYKVLIAAKYNFNDHPFAADSDEIFYEPKILIGSIR